MLVVVRPGMLQDSLSALLSTMSGVKVVSVTNDLESAINFVSEHHPKVCIIEISDQGDDQLTQFDRIKSISPEMKTIALVDEVEVKEAAESIGFDVVIIKGMPVKKLINTISDCIEEINCEPEQST